MTTQDRNKIINFLEKEKNFLDRDFISFIPIINHVEAIQHIERLLQENAKNSIMQRTCDSCGTPLPKGHGFVSKSGRRVTCGRTEVIKSVGDSLVKVKLKCGRWF